MLAKVGTPSLKRKSQEIWELFILFLLCVQVNQQIETNHSMQDKLHADLEHKDMALEIDRDCHEMHNDAIDIKVDRPNNSCMH